MIITKTPFRMSFFGGGTDMESFFRENGGAVISTTFDKYCYVTVRHLPRFFDFTTHLTYSKMEFVSGVDEIQHPAIRNAMKMLDMEEIRLIYEADLPARSGLGTSSSFAVGMLNAFYALKGKYVDKKKLADEAIYLERELCKEAGGWQDQIAASFGGFNRIDFNQDGTYDVKPVIIHLNRKKQLNNNLLMFFTGFTRFSSDMQKANAVGYAEKQAQLKQILILVDEAEKILEDKHSDLDDFGRLLDTTWKLKRQTGGAITTDSIDGLYEKGIKAGALGGKLLGAGGGGFLIFYVQPEKRESVMEAMKGLLYVPFQFEDGGTRVIHYTPESYEPRENRNYCGGVNLKTAIVGSSGYIAGYIIKRFEEDNDIKSMFKIGMDGNPDAVLNLEEPEKFDYETLNDIDYIIFTAAISEPDKCASDYDWCWNINVTGTSYFIREAIKRNCNVLFFSSDAVFGDIPSMIYDEESKTQAYTPYGKMKKAVEDEFKDNPNFKAIRLSYVASAKDRFITYCLNCIKNNEAADIFHPFYRNVIVVSDVVDVVAYFVKHWDEYEHTFLNVAGKELVSRVRMADELNRILNDKLKYTISMPREEFFTNRPKITQIRSLYMQQYGILPDNTFTEKLQREMEDIEI